jgi:hypothetical protein
MITNDTGNASAGAAGAHPRCTGCGARVLHHAVKMCSHCKNGAPASHVIRGGDAGRGGQREAAACQESGYVSSSDVSAVAS